MQGHSKSTATKAVMPARAGFGMAGVTASLFEWVVPHAPIWRDRRPCHKMQQVMYTRHVATVAGSRLLHVLIDDTGTVNDNDPNQRHRGKSDDQFHSELSFTPSTGMQCLYSVSCLSALALFRKCEGRNHSAKA
jgi:hypothetical protein